MITFSGIDCCGKSTQIDRIAEQYRQAGEKCRIIWSRGGYTVLVEWIKNRIRKDRGFSERDKQAYRAHMLSTIRNRKILLWFSIVDLIRLYGFVFRWIEWRGTTILCDRYIWDTYIDCKLKFNDIAFEDWLCWRLLLKLMKKPSLSIVFTIPAEESMRRSEGKEEPFPETYEERVIRIERYRQEIGCGRWQHVIDGTGEMDAITDRVWTLLQR